MRAARLAVLVLAAALLGGCAGSMAGDGELRVTEYRASGIGPAGVIVGGCRVTQRGRVSAAVRYLGERCAVALSPSPGEAPGRASGGPPAAPGGGPPGQAGIAREPP